MSGADDFPKARIWLETPSGRTYLGSLERWLEASEREKQVASAEARKAAQEAALKARAVMDAMLRATGLLRRRMLAAARGEPAGTAADERDFGKLMRPKTRTTRAGRAALRHAAGRYLLDNAPTLTVDFALWLTGQARSANAGFEGVLSHEPIAGVPPDGGTAHSLKEDITLFAAYTAGQKFKGDAIPSAFWAQAAKTHNAEAAKLRAKGLKVKAVKPLTVKDWCLREGEGKEQFEAARKDGRKDRAAGHMNRKRMLP